jgi:hypothetical protein
MHHIRRKFCSGRERAHKLSQEFAEMAASRYDMHRILLKVV